MPIVLKSSKELEKMRRAGRLGAGWHRRGAAGGAARRAGRLGAECHALVRAAIKPGVTTKQIDTLVYEHLARNNAKSPFLGYRAAGAPPFPGSVCASVN